MRLPIDVDKNLGYMKASLLRNLFFYILLVVLNDILPAKYYDNLSNLVSGVALLNSSSIPNSDLDRADELLTQFSKDLQELYGVHHMSANLLLLRHLKQCVIESGPLFF